MLKNKKIKRLGQIILLLLLMGCNKHNSKNNNSHLKVNDTLYVEKYDSGKTSVISSLKDKKFEGLYKSYHQNGNIKSIGINLKDKKEGIWKFYDEDGKLFKVDNYESGEVLFNLDVNDFLFKEIKLTPTDYSIKIPSKWSLNKIDNSLGLLNAEQLCSNTSQICPNVTITYESLNENSTYVDYVEKVILSLEKVIPDF